MKKLSFIIISLLIATTAMQAQSVSEWLQTARAAYESGDYRTALTSVAKIEEAVGSKTKPATAYLRIMSHYKLAEYNDCVSAANAYLAAQPAQDGTLQEIRTALADSKEQLRLAEVRKKEAQQRQAEAEQKCLAEEKAEQERINTQAQKLREAGIDFVEIAGVFWATCNVGKKGVFVENQYDYGNYYTWEEAETVCPAGWRLPTEEDWKSLVQYGSNAVDKGREFGKGDKKIFLPFAGYRHFSDNSMNEVGTDGNYWSGTPNGSDRAYLLGFADDHARIGSNNKKYAISVRCVCEDKKR